MPSRNVIRWYTPNSYYHIYNRGVERRDIFLDVADYKMFLYYLFIYLAPPSLIEMTYPELKMALRKGNLYSMLTIHSYVLMPNHFHMMLRQQSNNGISKLMKQLMSAYVEYFNTRYHHQGSPMQGRFKSVHVENDQQLLHLSRYIHLNPFIAGITQDLSDYKWSSYLQYIDQEKKTFCKKRTILSFFSSPHDYKKFVLDHADYAKELAKVKHLTFEELSPSS